MIHCVPDRLLMLRFPLFLLLLLTTGCQSSSSPETTASPARTVSFTGDASCASCHESETAGSASPADAIEPVRLAVGVDTTDVERLLTIARALQETGDFAEAEKFYLKALEKEPRNVDAMTNLGTLRARLGDLEGALEVLRPAALLGRESGNPSPILNTGLVAMESGLWDEAIQMLGFLVGRNPDHTGMRVLLARAMIGKGDFISALAQVNAGLKANPEHEAALLLKAELEARR